MGEIRCLRCRRQTAPVPGPTYPGPLGEEIAAKICGDCWAEWQHAEVMVINELRLNFMDPRAQEILVQHMREFLCLDTPPAEGA